MAEGKDQEEKRAQECGQHWRNSYSWMEVVKGESIECKWSTIWLFHVIIVIITMLTHIQIWSQRTESDFHVQAHSC